MICIVRTEKAVPSTGELCNVYRQCITNGNMSRARDCRGAWEELGNYRDAENPIGFNVIASLHESALLAHSLLKGDCGKWTEYHDDMAMARVKKTLAAYDSLHYTRPSNLYCIVKSCDATQVSQMQQHIFEKNPNLKRPDTIDFYVRLDAMEQMGALGRVDYVMRTQVMQIYLSYVRLGE